MARRSICVLRGSCLSSELSTGGGICSSSPSSKPSTRAISAARSAFSSALPSVPFVGADGLALPLSLGLAPPVLVGTLPATAAAATEVEGDLTRTRTLARASSPSSRASLATSSPPDPSAGGRGGIGFWRLPLLGVPQAAGANTNAGADAVTARASSGSSAESRL